MKIYEKCSFAFGLRFIVHMGYKLDPWIAGAGNKNTDKTCIQGWAGNFSQIFFFTEFGISFGAHTLAWSLTKLKSSRKHMNVVK